MSFGDRKTGSFSYCQVTDVIAHCAHGMAEKCKYLKGKLLLDAGKLAGTFFHHSVVLICQHDAEGALGVILNRPAPNTLGESVGVEIPEKLKEQPLFVGGPVQPQALSFLHSDTFVPHANVLPNLNLAHSLENLVELGESYSNTQQVKTFAGYSGWSAGQLEEEIKRGAWIIHTATLDLVFSADVQNLWRNILKKKEWPHSLLASAPEDFSWN